MCSAGGLDLNLRPMLLLCLNLMGQLIQGSDRSIDYKKEN